MITNVMSNSPFLMATHSPQPYISGYNGNVNSFVPIGTMRFNTNSQQMEVWDGNTWVMMSSTANVELTPEANELLIWAREKKKEEAELAELAKKHPGIKELKDQLTMLTILAKENHADS